jgi:hypothetical protein
MRPRFGVPTTSLRRTEATRAAAICQQLITLVEDTLLGRTSCTVFVEDTQPIADQLAQLLSQTGCGLDDRLEWFRDYLLPSGDYEAHWPGERWFCDFGLGVPVFGGDEGHFHLHYRLTLEWLDLMRDFSQTLREVAAANKRPSSAHGKGGRPKLKDVLTLERDVQRFYMDEAQRLRKEGLDLEAVAGRLKGLTKSDVLQQLQGNPCWASTGTSDEAMLKRIGRTPAWQQLHAPLCMAPVSGQDESSDVEAACPRRDNGWALMNQMNVRSGTRTKLERGNRSAVLSGQS